MFIYIDMKMTYFLVKLVFIFFYISLVHPNRNTILIDDSVIIMIDYGTPKNYYFYTSAIQ